MHGAGAQWAPTCVCVKQIPLTNAFSTHILLVPHVALTAVAGWGGDTASVQAEVGEMLADVNGLI